MIKIKQAIIVEGKYDKIRLSNILDTTIITTDGFGIFKNSEKRDLIRLLAEKCGIIIMTDSDRAGQILRRHIADFVKIGEVKTVYLPAISGKERRKTIPSADGILGVEGLDDNIIIEALDRAGVLSAPKENTRKITKTDLFSLGLSGAHNSQRKRLSLCNFLGLPALPSNTLLDALNSIYSYEEFLKEIEKWKPDETEN